ncbi:MAG: hypothetical protein KF813_03435 [Trueperaceae bacterium]|nr:hypothetical protein [Trueperaceae bacterium]
MPGWLRLVLYATFALNALGAYTFLPPGRSIREMGGLPIGQDPMYLTCIAVFILVIGLFCLGAAVTGRADKQLLGLVGSGKLAFVAVMAGFRLAGEIPGRAVAAALPDVLIGLVLVGWVLAVGRPDPTRSPTA